jgi:hypothetical protein
VGYEEGDGRSNENYQQCKYQGEHGEQLEFEEEAGGNRDEIDKINRCTESQ